MSYVNNIKFGPGDLAALRKSIRKWHRIAYDGAQDRGVDDCAFCGLHYMNSCAECPVRQRSGRWVCRGTPYTAWLNALPNLNNDSSASTLRAKRAAEKMLTYLVEMLPEGETAEVDGWVYYTVEGDS